MINNDQQGGCCLQGGQFNESSGRKECLSFVFMITFH
jgi:hypothetical protein